MGRTIRAVAMQRSSSVTPTRSLPSNGVPGIGTRALTGKDSGASGSLAMLVSEGARTHAIGGTYWLISQINPTRSPSSSPSPMIPPLHTLIPASRTAARVSILSSYFRVVMTCSGRAGRRQFKTRRRSIAGRTLG